MQRIWSIKKISVILIIALIFYNLLAGSCATGKNRTVDIELRAEAVPEGILLTFNNLPSDTSHLWISVLSYGDAEELENPYGIVSSFAGISNTSDVGWIHGTQQLEKVKQTGKVIFPIVQAGEKYNISAFVYTQQEHQQSREDIYFQPRMVEAECIAENGIYFNRDLVKLELDNANSSITLSSEPVFSSEVAFYTPKYSFGVTILVSETASIGIGDHHIPDGISSDGLTWTFEPQMTQVNLREFNSENNWLENGSYYPAWAEAMVNIIYEDITWSVGIAKTPEFSYSLGE